MENKRHQDIFRYAVLTTRFIDEDTLRYLAVLVDETQSVPTCKQNSRYNPNHHNCFYPIKD